jgi:hypothetical protein
MTRWRLAHGPIRCTVAKCNAVIAAGDRYRLMSKADLPYCLDCARQAVPGEATPTVAELGPSGVSARPVESFGAQFDRTVIGAKLRGNVLDWRARQAGER